MSQSLFNISWTFSPNYSDTFYKTRKHLQIYDIVISFATYSTVSPFLMQTDHKFSDHKCISLY